MQRYGTMADMKKKKTPKKAQKKQEGYSPKELNIHMHAYIKDSAKRLRKELQNDRKKQQAQKRRPYHKIDREKEGYSPKEMRALTNQMIDDMVIRLRKRLRDVRRQQERGGRVQDVRHEVAV